MRGKEALNGAGTYIVTLRMFIDEKGKFQEWIIMVEIG